MPKQQPSQKLELCDGKVGERASLASLFAHDANADVSSLYHVDIVRPISDCQCRFILANTFDESNESCLLLGRRSVDDKAFSLQKSFDQGLSLFQIIIRHVFDLVDEHLDSCSAD